MHRAHLLLLLLLTFAASGASLSAPASQPRVTDVLAAYDIAEQTLEAYEVDIDLRDNSVKISRYPGGWQFHFGLLPDARGFVVLHSSVIITVGDDARVKFLPF